MLTSSGRISMGGSETDRSINIELNQTATSKLTLNDSNARTLAGISSGRISLADFYGKSSGGDPSGDVGTAYFVKQDNHAYIGLEAVDFATYSVFASGFNYAYDSLGAGRLRTPTVSLSLGAAGIGYGSSYKNTGIRGILMDTATSFVAGVTSVDVRAGCSDFSTNNGLGYRMSGWYDGAINNGSSQYYTNSIKYNLTTYSNSILNTNIGPNIYIPNAGSESKTKGYAIYSRGIVNDYRTNATLVSFVFATETFVDNNQVIPGAPGFGTVYTRSAYRSKNKAYYYENLSAGTGSAFVNNTVTFATETLTKAGASTYTNLVTGGIDYHPALMDDISGGHHYVASRANAHVSGGHYFPGGMFWQFYNYTARHNFLTDTWFTPGASYFTNADCAFGHERYIEPTV
jgi:hypothetical protein